MGVVHRLTDRIHPWRASDTPIGPLTAVVVGAGPAGLATAALLRRRGLDVSVVDRRPSVGGSWPDRYDSLRLNTVRWMSDLPGYRMPRRLGRWVGRDDLAGYLRRYADHHGLVSLLGRTVGRIEPVGPRWSVDIDGAPAIVDVVVVATGHSARPWCPEWRGATEFTGRVLHSAEYRRPSDHAGRRVLVVGAGSSGGEICVDLARAGVDVTWSVRTAPRVFPREVGRVPTTPFAPIGDAVPARLLDRLAPQIERLIYGPRDYLPDSPESMMTLLARCKEPMTADGIVNAIRRGRVRVVDEVADLTVGGARLADGTIVPADDVVAATGHQPGLGPLVGHLGVLDDHGRPVALNPRTGLAFVGFRIPFAGTLWAIDRDARDAAHRLGGEERAQPMC